MKTDGIGEALRTEAQADLVAEAVGLVAYAQAQELLAQVQEAISQVQAQVVEHDEARGAALAEVERAKAHQVEVRAAAQHPTQAERQRVDAALAEARRRVVAAIEAVQTHQGAAHEGRQRLADLEALAEALHQVERPELLALPILLAAALPS